MLSQESLADRDRGLEFMAQARAIWLRKRAFFLIPVTDVWAARELARRGDRGAAIEQMRDAVDELRQMGHVFYGFWATGVFVEALLQRRDDGDLVEAHAAINEMAVLTSGAAMCDVTVLRLRALLAYARSDDSTYRDCRDRYRSMVSSLGFEQHSTWADEMP